MTGDCTRFELRTPGEMTLDGLISNTCTEDVEQGPEVRLIVDGDLTLGTEISDEPVIISDGDIWISDPESEDLDLTPIVPEEATLAFRPRSAAHLAAAVRTTALST